MRTLSNSELSFVNGADIGDATAGGAVAGAIATGGGAVALANGARMGLAVGAAFGIFGVVGGAVVGGAIGYWAYKTGAKFAST